MFKRGSSTSEYNLTLRRLASGRRTAEVLEKAAEMKNLGIQPDSLTYSTILQALAGEGMYDVMWAVIREMQAIGIPPSVSHFNYLLSVSRSYFILLPQPDNFLDSVPTISLIFMTY